MADEIERLLRNFLEKRKNEHLHDNVQRKNTPHHLKKEDLEQVSLFIYFFSLSVFLPIQ